MVGSKECGIALVATERGKPVVAKPACGILGTEAVGAGIFVGLELRHMDGHSIGLCKGTDERLVAVAVAGTQVEVAMGNGKGISSRMHKVRQDNGVYAPTDSKQHLLPSREEVLLTDVCYELLKHYLIIILCMRRCPSYSTP